VRLGFYGSSVPDGFEVAGVSLRGEAGTARPWALYEVAAERAPAGVYPEVFRNRQVYWTVAGGPQAGAAESLLDEWGGFALRADGPMLAPLLVTAAGVESARQAQALEHRLGAGGAPMPEVVWRMAAGLTLRIRALARPGSASATTWVAYELQNDSIMTQTGRLAWVARPVRIPPPWAGGGLVPVYKLRHVHEKGGWQEMLANEEFLFAAADPELEFAAAEFDRGDIAEFFLRGQTPKARSAADETGLASAAWWLDFNLEPGERLRRVVAGRAARTDGGHGRLAWSEAAGGAEKAADAFDSEWVDAEWGWRALTGDFAPRIDRPDAIECLQAQTGWLLAVREWAGGGAGETLDAIQLRVAALLRAGQPEAAKMWIDRVAAAVTTNGHVPAVYRPDGAPVPDGGPLTPHASQGQFAFMALDYYRFTQDLSFLHAVYPTLKAVLARLAELRAAQEQTEWRMDAEERFLLEGLLPPAGAQPGRSQPEHLYADHYWALLAWKEGRTAASRLGNSADAAWADENYRLLKSSVRRSLRANLDRRESSWLPAAAEEERFDASALALLFWPCEETDLVEPYELQSSLDRFYEEFLDRQESGWTGRVPTDESLLLGALARAGRGHYAREVLYFLLERRQPPGWDTWPDAMGSDLRQPGQAGFMPDIRASASFVLGVRDLVARENGQKLDVLSGMPAEWLQYGEGFRVYGMPTAFGPLELAGYWHLDQFTVEIGGGADPPEGYRVWWPLQVKPDQVQINGLPEKKFDKTGMDVPHDFKGKIEVVFPVKAPWPREP
jgi:hypothetical protein